MTDEELKALVASLAIAQKEMNEQIIYIKSEIYKINIRLDELFSNPNENNILEEIFYCHETPEEFFYRSFKRNPVINGIHFDWVEKQLHNRVGEIEDKYDIILLNGNSLAVIEVKLKAHVNDLEKLLFKKMANFPVLFTMYKDYKKYAGLATLVTNDELIEKAKELGLFLFTQHGKHTEVVNTGRLLN